MNIASVTEFPKQTKPDLMGLQEKLEAVMEDFMDANPDLHAVCIIGMLAVLQRNMIERMENA